MILPEILAMKDPIGALLKGAWGEAGGRGGDKSRRLGFMVEAFLDRQMQLPCPDSSNILKIHVLIRIPSKGSHKGTIPV